MAKKEKTYLETIMSDFKKGERAVKDAVSRLESRVQSRESRIAFLEKELQEQKAYYEFQFMKIFGVNIETYLIGYEFEKHVVWWMNKYCRKYVLKVWQGDKCASTSYDDDIIIATWNTYPDLIYVNKENTKVVALECKYRQNGKLSIDKQHYAHYEAIEKQIRDNLHIEARVYVMVGSSGSSSHRPDYMYCVPLYEFKGEREVDMRNIPQYKVMDRSVIGQEIATHKENIPF